MARLFSLIFLFSLLLSLASAAPLNDSPAASGFKLVPRLDLDPTDEVESAIDAAERLMEDLQRLKQRLEEAKATSSST